jgi:phage tail-like protein
MIEREPLLNHRFGVFFFIAGVVPNPLDIYFESVSGLDATISMTTYREGGETLYEHRLPDQITYSNLVLKRGIYLGSPLTIEFNATMTLFKFLPSNVLVAALNEDKVPMAAWMFIKAYPVRWLTDTLSAETPKVLVETMELAYSRMQVVRV